MKHTRVMLVLAALLLALGATACADKAFVDEYGSPPPANPRVSAWIVAAGAIWHTANGGADWERQVGQAPRNLIGVTFADAQHGWAVGMQGLILATTDGGRTWATQASTGPSLWHVTCVDEKHVWAIGPSGALTRSADGGSTWHSREVSGVDMILSGGGGIAFADAKHGLIASGDAVRASSDGGRTWAIRYQRKGLRLRGVACCDAEHAWAVGTRGYDDEPVIVSTSDGGTSWTVQHVGKPGVDLGGFALSAVACADGQHAWAAGSRQGAVAVTSDGGSTWQVKRVPGHLSEEAIAAADADHVLLTTGGQPVMVSSDGGLTWAASGRSDWLGDSAQGVAAVSSATP